MAGPSDAAAPEIAARRRGPRWLLAAWLGLLLLAVGAAGLALLNPPAPRPPVIAVAAIPPMPAPPVPPVVPPVADAQPTPAAPPPATAEGSAPAAAPTQPAPATATGSPSTAPAAATTTPPAAPTASTPGESVLPGTPSTAAVPDLPVVMRPPVAAPPATAPATPARPGTTPAPQTAAVPGARVPPAWIRHQRPFDANDRRPRVAVVLGELGLTARTTEEAIRTLPPAVTLIFSPYAPRLEDWVELARNGGHEVLLGLPMEPTNFPAVDPGPQTLLTALTPQQNLERLDWVLGRVEGIVGVASSQGSRFSATPEALRPIITALVGRGMMILDSRATPRSVIPRLASELGLPRAISDRTIDVEASRVAIDARLAEIERIARESGTAVAMGAPYPVTLERLMLWLGTLEEKNLALAPLTAVANRQRDR